GTVYKYDDGNSDAGTNISYDALQAFNYFGTKARKKAFKEVEPIFQSNGDPRVAIDLNLDFQVKAFQGVTAASSASAARWGVSKWGIGTWGGPDQVYRGWRGVRGVGRAAAVRVRGETTGPRPSWLATNYKYQ